MAIIKIPDGNAFKLRVTAMVNDVPADLNVVNNIIVNFVRRGRIAQPYGLDSNGRLVIANDGSLARGLYGVELTGYHDGKPWRHYIKNAFKIVDENEDADTPTVVDDVPVYDLSDNMSFGGDGVTAAYVDNAIAAHDEDEEAHEALQAKMADKVDDVLVDGESVVETDPVTGKRTVGFHKDQFGKVDDVKVNGESVLNENNEAEITVPTKTSELDNDEDFATNDDVDEKVAAHMVNEVNVSVDNTAPTGQPSAEKTFQDGVLGITFKNVKGEKGDKLQFSDLTEEEKASLKGRPGADRQPVESGDVIIAHSLGGDETKVMSQNAVSEALGSQALGSGLYEESVNLSGMTVGTGLSISADGKIATSSVTGAKIKYFEVSSGDIVKINILEQNANRVAWGLFPDLNVDTEALQYENYVTSDMTIGKDYLFHVTSAGYFAIYSLNTHTATVMRGKGGMTNRKIPFNTYVGGGIYVADVEAVNYGTVGSNAYRRYTDYIDVSRIARLMYARTVTDGTTKVFGMAFYDVNKAFISGESNLPNQAFPGYEISTIDVPSNAKYARFTLWESTSAGEFFVCDADADPMGRFLAKELSADVSTKAIVIGGHDNVAVQSQKIYAKKERVLKFTLADNVPFTSSSTDTRFEIVAYDASNVLVERLFKINNPIVPPKEIVVITPSTFDHIKVSAKCNTGERYVISVEDVTESYQKVKYTADNINAYLYNTSKTRFIAMADYVKGAFLRLVQKSTECEACATYMSINSEHEPTQITGGYDWSDNVLQYYAGKLDNVAYLMANIRKVGETTMTKADALAAYDIYLYYPKSEEDTVNLQLKDNERRWKFYGWKENIGSNTKNVQTNYLAIPRVGMSVRMDIPSWLKVRFRYGNRDEVDYTQYYYKGDVVTFTKDSTQVAMYAQFSSIDNNRYRGLDKDFYNDANISLTILDVKDGDIINRNFDTEKVLGAIKATPESEYNYTNDLPCLVHVSDVHGDAVRMMSACDYADYLKADLLINTGDNPFYLHSNGVDFVTAIIGNVKSEYAGCIGNHDTYIGSANISTIYNAHIAPFAERYGWHKESDEDVTDECYYYKDLDAKKLRIIALDIYDEMRTASYKARISQTQIEWFIDTLASTPEDYGVIIITHQAPHGIAAISGKEAWNDSGMDVDCASVDSDYMQYGKITGNPFGKIIDAFIGKTTVSDSYTQKVAASSTSETISYSADFTNVAEGVEFVCYLNGHTHRDWVGYVKDCEHRQLNINCCSTNPISQSRGFRTACDIYRDSNGVNQDAFNVYTINRIDKTVGIVRIGSCITKELKERRVTFVNYADE